MESGIKPQNVKACYLFQKWVWRALTIWHLSEGFYTYPEPYLFACHSHLIHHRVLSLQYESSQWSLPTADALLWVPWKRELQNKFSGPFNILRNILKSIRKWTYFSPPISAVALDTRNTNVGRILFPPAPNICSAADIKTGFSAPTIYQRISIRLKVNAERLK